MERPDGAVNAPVDRLFELPISIVNRILSFLPTRSVIQMSVLEKQWRQVWTQVPTLDFDNCRDVPPGSGPTVHQRYFELIGQALKKRCKFCDISKFRLCIEFRTSGCTTAQVSRWLQFPLKKNVKELDLFFGNSPPYHVPRAIFRLQSLVVLKLRDVTVRIKGPSRLPRLKVLQILNSGTEDDSFHSILSGCVSIEELVLKGCLGLQNLHISSSSLKSMEVEGNESNEIESITVEAPNLRSFVYESLYDNGSDNCTIDLSNCKEIRKLSIRGLPLDYQWFKDLMSKAPLLENLNIAHCHDFQHIRISYKHLKKLGLAWKRVTIDAPSLVFFHFTGCSIFDISVKAPSLKEVIVQISKKGPLDINSKWSVDLLNFLSNFNNCNNVRLLFQRELPSRRN